MQSFLPPRAVCMATDVQKLALRNVEAALRARRMVLYRADLSALMKDQFMRNTISIGPVSIITIGAIVIMFIIILWRVHG